MSEQQPANGVKGFLLHNPVDHKHFFRVYDPQYKSEFKDYRLGAEDIEIEIVDTHIVLRSVSKIDPDMGVVDYSDAVLGREQRM